MQYIVLPSPHVILPIVSKYFSLLGARSIYEIEMIIHIRVMLKHMPHLGWGDAWNYLQTIGSYLKLPKLGGAVHNWDEPYMPFEWKTKTFSILQGENLLDVLRFHFPSGHEFASLSGRKRRLARGKSGKRLEAADVCWQPTKMLQLMIPSGLTSFHPISKSLLFLIWNIPNTHK